MLSSPSIKDYWHFLESKKSPPKFVRKINIIKFDELKESINKKNELYVKNLAKTMYNGEAYILRNAAKKI